jgi:DNA mismatch endonuclease (patch repair protein)
MASRRHQPLTGKPDFVFPEQRLAVFVDGCFWHACPRCYIKPKQNAKSGAKK